MTDFRTNASHLDALCVNCGHDARCHNAVYFFGWIARWECHKQWGAIPEIGKALMRCFCRQYTPSKPSSTDEVGVIK